MGKAKVCECHRVPSQGSTVTLNNASFANGSVTGGAGGVGDVAHPAGTGGSQDGGRLL